MLIRVDRTQNGEFDQMKSERFIRKSKDESTDDSSLLASRL